ncbi:fibronectin type III domain-containing protein [Maribacter polysaccharolyticus]|uniref:fibronectin type III domain-containing protein n=1 Tax=Maribacter polysaccharolyticus TaxID=3020831 RepID=UPI00237F2681|nr:fibronectin type III domain-containing protein [Maribacter polysaccharolyticus]MDE3743063.1 fibronectin type III domain-containing protein [Maribacter polysaccharolyticus]
MAICTLYTILGYSQNFPVQVIPQAIPPAPIHFSDYADASTVSSPLRVQIILNDLEIANREVRLKAHFQGNGITFQSNDIVVGADPLFLEGGVPLILTNVELAPYFQFQNITGISPNVYGQAIPEGAYQFCFEVYDVLSWNRLSNKSCATTVVFQNEPPFLVMPRDKSNIEEINPQNIVFQWTPRSINVTNVEYELSLVEIWDTQIDPQAAFLSSPPVFQTTTTATTYVYGPADPLLLSGKNYAWRVQARAKQGIEEIGLYKNEGYSEIFSFSYAGSCDLPLSLNHEVKGSTNANIFWEDFTTDIPEYTVRYRKKGDDNEWFLSKTTTNQLSLWDLKAGTTYEYQIQKKCTVTGSDWSLAKEFTTSLEFEEESVIDCGISPDINLTNTDPLASISTGTSFKAGDFPVKITEVSGSNGRFTGKGYVSLPYLKNIKVAVEFTNILINTDQEMAEGTVNTVYDPTWKNMLSVDEAIETVTNSVDAVGELIESADDFLDEIFNNDDEDEENAPPMETEGDEGDSGNTTTDTTNGNEENPSTDDSSSSQGNSAGPNYSNGDQNTADTGDIASGTNTDSENTTSSGEEVVIVHNGIEYKNNEVIEVPYDKNNANYAFLLKNYPEGATFNWQILYQGSDYTPRHVTNEPIHDNLGIDMKKVYILDVVANYNDQKIQVRIKRKLPDFDLVNIYAKPEDSKDRVAKTGQKLYLQKSPTPGVDAQRNVDFSVHISPNLSKGDISSQDITWYYDTPNTQSNLGKDYGVKDIHLNLTEQESTYSVNVKAGKPDLIEKGIDVVWFDSNERSWSFMPPAVSQVLTKKFVEIEDGLKLVDRVFPVGKVNFELDDIKINGTEVNKEDVNSRLYYLEQKESVSGGLKVDGPKLPIPIPILEPLNRSGILKIGPYVQPSFGISVQGGVERKKYIESSTFKKDENYLEITASGCVSAGVEVELLVAKNLLDFVVDFKGTGCLSGSGNYNFNNKKLVLEVYIPPVILSGEINIATKGTLEFELVNWSRSISITDKIPLGDPFEHQF